jgi:hypothetical protein
MSDTEDIDHCLVCGVSILHFSWLDAHCSKHHAEWMATKPGPVERAIKHRFRSKKNAAGT